MGRGRKTAAAALTVTAVLLAGCSDKGLERFRDAPRGDVNDSPAEVITFPDGFSNVATKCSGSTRVFVIFHGDSPYGSVAAVPNDETCR